MSDAPTKDSVRTQMTLVFGFVQEMRTQLGYLCEPDEIKAFNKNLVAWAEGISKRHAATGCYSNMPEGYLSDDMRKVPCLVCGLTIGAAQGKNGVTAGFFEAVVDMTATGLGVKGSSPS